MSRLRLLLALALAVLAVPALSVAAHRGTGGSVKFDEPVAPLVTGQQPLSWQITLCKDAQGRDTGYGLLLVNMDLAEFNKGVKLRPGSWSLKLGQGTPVLTKYTLGAQVTKDAYLLTPGDHDAYLYLQGCDGPPPSDHVQFRTNWVAVPDVGGSKFVLLGRPNQFYIRAYNPDIKLKGSPKGWPILRSPFPSKRFPNIDFVIKGAGVNKVVHMNPNTTSYGAKIVIQPKTKGFVTITSAGTYYVSRTIRLKVL